LKDLSSETSDLQVVVSFNEELKENSKTHINPHRIVSFNEELKDLALPTKHHPLVRYPLMRN